MPGEILNALSEWEYHSQSLHIVELSHHLLYVTCDLLVYGLSKETSVYVCIAK